MNVKFSFQPLVDSLNRCVRAFCSLDDGLSIIAVECNFGDNFTFFIVEFYLQKSYFAEIC